jgi:hypothetical protein
MHGNAVTLKQGTQLVRTKAAIHNETKYNWGTQVVRTQVVLDTQVVNTIGEHKL